MELKEATNLKHALEMVEVCRSGLEYKQDIRPPSRDFIALGDRITELEVENEILLRQVIDRENWKAYAEETKAQRDELFKIAESRINAQSDLLVCYRIGKRPSEKLHGRLNKSELQWEKIKQPVVDG